MTLEEILRNPERLGDDDVVYAKRPWTLESEARVLQYSVDETVPRVPSEDPSFEYFLEGDLLTDARRRAFAAAGRLQDTRNAATRILALASITP